MTLSAGNNGFEGSIPNDLYFIPTLASLDVSNNE